MLSLAALCLLLSPSAAEEPPLRLLGAVSLPGVEGRFDHFAVDVKAERLYVAALGNGSLEVISLDTTGGKVKSAGRIGGLEEPQGVLAVPGTGEVAVASGKDGLLKVFDGSSLRLLHRLEAGGDADNVRFDAAAKRVYVGCDRRLAIVDATSWTKVGEIPLAGHAESFQLEKNGKRIFVNVPTAGHVAVIDREKGAVTATWTLEGAPQNYPMALDEPHHRLLVGCRKPPRIAVLNTASGKQVAAVDTSGDMDDLFIEAASPNRIYATCGEGFIDVCERSGPDSYQRVARIATAPGARTALLVPELKVLCVAVPHRGEREAEVRVYKTAD